MLPAVIAHLPADRQRLSLRQVQMANATEPFVSLVLVGSSLGENIVAAIGRPRPSS
jgi:hypothetical protein